MITHSRQHRRQGNLTVFLGTNHPLQKLCLHLEKEASLRTDRRKQSLFCSDLAREIWIVLDTWIALIALVISFITMSRNLSDRPRFSWGWNGIRCKQNRSSLKLKFQANEVTRNFFTHSNNWNSRIKSQEWVYSWALHPNSNTAKFINSKSNTWKETIFSLKTCNYK